MTPQIPVEILVASNVIQAVEICDGARPDVPAHSAGCTTPTWSNALPASARTALATPAGPLGFGLAVKMPRLDSRSVVVSVGDPCFANERAPIDQRDRKQGRHAGTAAVCRSPHAAAATTAATLKGDHGAF